MFSADRSVGSRPSPFFAPYRHPFDRTAARLLPVLALSASLGTASLARADAACDARLAACIAGVQDQPCGDIAIPPGQTCSQVKGRMISACRTRFNCPPPQTVGGTLKPKFYVLTVIYAPPGSAAGSRSSVDYSTESSTGSSVTVSHSFKGDVQISASATLLTGLKAGVSGGFSASTTDGRSLDIKKTASLDIKVQGGSADGIDHDADLIYLWLNPTVAVVARDQTGQWALGTDGAPMDIQYVYVAWLKDPTLMPAGLAARLNAYGLTSDDFRTMLELDPFAQGATAIDEERFSQTITTFPYEPPLRAGDPPPTLTLTMKNDMTTATTHSGQSEYSVGFSVSGGPFADWLGLELKTSSTFTWTDSHAWTDSEVSSQAASCTVAGPSFGYTGPTDIAVYWDNNFGSFMFVPASGPAMAVGKVVDAAGRPVAHREVMLTVGNQKRRTFTTSRGEYRFTGVLTGRGSIRVGNQKQQVTVGPAPSSKTFKLRGSVQP